jgi:3'(2'), 5'-bisphosphate nucleotidase
METDYFKLLEFAVCAAQNASAAITSVKSRGYETNYKSDASPVTEADLAAHQAISEVLAPVGLPLLSEEGTLPGYETRKHWDRYWSIDPLDGTKEFVRGSKEYTVNIALIENQRPIIGVIALPETKEIMWGGKVTGLFHSKCFLELEHIFESKHLTEVYSLPKEFTALVSRAHLNSKTKHYLSMLEQKHGEVKITRAGSSTKFMALALQKAHLYPRFSPCMEWDTAAGHAFLLASDQDIMSLETNAPLLYNRESLYNPPFIAGKAEYHL